MAEPGYEHRIVDRRRDRVAFAVQQCRRNRAVVTAQALPDAGIHAVAQRVDDHGIFQPQPAVLRWRGDLDRSMDKAGGADALEIQIAREVVRTGSKRREWRRQAGLELGEAADRRRRPLLHRQADTPDLGQRPARAAQVLHAGHAQHESIGLLALFADLDKSRQRHRIERTHQHIVRDNRRTNRGSGEAGADRGGQCRHREKPAAPDQEGNDAREAGDRRHKGNQWLALGGEIEDDARTKADRDPRQELGPRGFSCDRGPQPFDDPPDTFRQQAK